MPDATTYQHLREDHIPTAARLLHHAFGGALDGCEKWVKNEVGLPNVRCLSAGGAPPLACLGRVPMATFFGGKSVSTLGIAGVAVAPEARGQGLARRLMDQLILEAHADGFALSSLYPSTVSLYRQSGYEVAGHRFVVKLPARNIDVRDTKPVVRPLSDRDEPAVRACYTNFARQYDGMLDRGEYIWRRSKEFRDKSFTRFGIDSSVASKQPALDAYLALCHVREPGGVLHELHLSDLIFNTPESGRRLLSFLADFATTVTNIMFSSGPLHPILPLMQFHRYEITRQESWMVRIVNVHDALTSRGYPRHVTASLQLNITDPLVKSNNGAWTLDLEHGRATVRKEAAVRPALSLSINALAALYTGLFSARQACALGWIDDSHSDDAALSAAESIFPAGAPHTPDFF